MTSPQGVLADPGQVGEDEHGRRLWLRRLLLRAALVKKTPSWPRSWANFSLLQLYSRRNA
jgi:hypothetical protein